MNQNLIQQADILDIIFEKRNQSYGAYDLRKFYPNRLKLALVCMFICAAAFSAFTLLPRKKLPVSTKVYSAGGPELTHLPPAPKQPEPKKERVKQPEKTAIRQIPVAQKAYTSNVKIVANRVKTDSLVTIMPEDNIAAVAINKPGSGPFLVTPMKTDTNKGTTITNLPAIDKTTPVASDVVEVLPAFPGGMEALMKFLQKNLQTPDEMEPGETVQVRVRFVVDYTGKLKGFSTVLDGGEAYNQEVIRVLKKMPDWIPGKTRGENVSVYYVIPVKFTGADL